MLVYFSVTTGYRAGGQNLRGTSDATLTPFKPETLMQFEAGFSRSSSTAAFASTEPDSTRSTTTCSKRSSSRPTP